MLKQGDRENDTVFSSHGENSTFDLNSTFLNVLRLSASKIVRVIFLESFLWSPNKNNEKCLKKKVRLLKKI